MANKKWHAREINKPDQQTIDRFWSSVDKSGECWLWTKSTTGPMGYGQFNCCGTILAAHRMSYAIVHGRVPPDTLVCHTCDNPICVNPDHLFLGDYLINNQDMFAKGRGHIFEGTHILGTDNHNAKLDAQKVREAVWLRSCGLSFKDIAERFQVSVQAIFPIFDGQTWKHAVGIIGNDWMTEQELLETQVWWKPYEDIHKSKPAGEESTSAKLTEAEVMEIIWLRSQGLTMEELAIRYRVCKSAVKAIFSGTNWPDITGRLIINRQKKAIHGRPGYYGSHT
jgi:hypothetical protein